VHHLVPPWLFKYPVLGIFMQLFRPIQYPFSRTVNYVVETADALALIGFIALMAAGLWSLRRLPWNPEQWALAWFSLLIVAVSKPEFWVQVYNYGRPLSPLIFLCALQAIRNWGYGALAPVGLIAFRVLIQVEPQVVGIVRGLL
jgi:hypothetical protein